MRRAKTFLGYHDFPAPTGEWVDNVPKRLGRFEVEYLQPMEGAGSPPRGTGYYWRKDNEYGVYGPFPTAEGAYLDAIGD